jgi:hypothetical protein
VSDIPYTTTYPTFVNGNDPVPERRSKPEASSEVERCISAYLSAYRQSSRELLPQEQCMMVARLAFDAQFQIEVIGLKQMANPKGLVS